MGNKVSFDCYCPKCNGYIGSWWHYKWAPAPIFMPYPCSPEKPEGYPFCWACECRIYWSDIIKKQTNIE